MMVAFVKRGIEPSYKWAGWWFSLLEILNIFVFAGKFLIAGWSCEFTTCLSEKVVSEPTVEQKFCTRNIFFSQSYIYSSRSLHSPSRYSLYLLQHVFLNVVQEFVSQKIGLLCSLSV